MTAYQTWNAAGRPLTPAPTIAALVGLLRGAYPDHASGFGWYADDAHYQADPPLDHTPYSVDEWPVASPGYVVFATDVMARDVGGTAALDKLFRYWLDSAKSGRAPWIKYLIWQATLYDVRYGWKAQANSDHFDHVHVSARTDVQTLGNWTALPLERTDMPFLVSVTGGPTKGAMFISDGFDMEPVRNDAAVRGALASVMPTVNAADDAQAHYIGSHPRPAAPPVAVTVDHGDGLELSIAEGMARVLRATGFSVPNPLP